MMRVEHYVRTVRISFHAPCVKYYVHPAHITLRRVRVFVGVTPMNKEAVPRC